MKKLLISSTLLMSYGLFAGHCDSGCSNSQSCCANTSCCESSCGCDSTCSPRCEPCCTPEPPKCIECECYTPKYYDLQCAWNVFLRGDFLYWYARETNLAYAQKLEVLSTGPNLTPGFRPDNFFAFPKEYKYLDAKWKPGLRIGLGFNGNCDGWDLAVDWTYYRNKSSKSSTTPFEGNVTFPTENQQALLNPWVNSAFFPVLSNILFLNEAISASWHLTFNQIDLTIGRKYWLSRFFTLRPFAAIRGIRTTTNFNVNALLGPKTITISSPPTSLTNFILTTKDRFQNDYWGVGLLAGLRPNWYFSRSFSIYVDLDVALVWGQFEGKKDEDYLNTLDFDGSPTTAQKIHNKIRGDTFARMLPMLDGGIGVRFEDSYCCNRYRIALDLGWEHHVLFNAGLRYKNIAVQNTTTPQAPFPSPTFNFTRNFIGVQGDIQMGGLVTRLQFDF